MYPSDYDNALAAYEAVSAEYFNVIDCGAVNLYAS